MSDEELVARRVVYAYFHDHPDGVWPEHHYVADECSDCTAAASAATSATVAALSAAGRLLPEGGEEHAEWAVNADGSSLGRGPIPTVGDVPAGRVMVAELREKYGVEAWLESRTVRTFPDGSVLTGPWNEVTE